MNGDQLMAKLLKKEGTEWISCFPAQTLIEACSQEGIRPILCRQERAGVNMADAYSRINNGNKILLTEASKHIHAPPWTVLNLESIQLSNISQTRTIS